MPQRSATLTLLPSLDAVAPLHLHPLICDLLFCARHFFLLRLLSIRAAAKQQPPPCLCFATPAASSTRSSWTRCAVFWGGPRRSLSGGFGQARFPSTTWPRGSSSSSTPTPCAGWCRQSPPSYSCSWRSSAFSFNTSPPTPSSSWPSSPTSWRCSWGSVPVLPSSGIFTPWSSQGGASARSVPTTSSSSKGRLTPTSAPSPVPSGRTGVTAGSSPRLTPMTAWSC
jgi:hypothetical protein